jgi:hypothetical protein
VFTVLRRARRRSGGVDLRWPFYLIAGAGAGILSVISEVLTRTAGAQVLDLAGKVSELERSVQQILSTNRLNSALIVLFVGAFTAMVAVGRTLSPAEDEPDEDEQDATAGAADVASAPIGQEAGATNPSPAAEPDGTAAEPDGTAAETASTAAETAGAGEPVDGGKPVDTTPVGDRT